MIFPVEVSPLSKNKPDKPDFVESFELYAAGKAGWYNSGYPSTVKTAISVPDDAWTRG